MQTRDPETGWCYKNGGQALWGYRTERLVRGEEKKGRPIIKSIWLPDETVVAGKPVSEWARHCLLMAAEGASLDELRDFCNENGIPAPRKPFWGSTTWYSLLHPHCVLEYAGYGVWNVRSKNRRYNPPSEWVVVENAHPALISEEEARRILEARKARAAGPWRKTSNRARSSRFLLSGGLFTCRRCGGNLVGFYKGPDEHYYVCNSIPNRRGVGCGRGVYVPQKQIESQVIAGLRELASLCGAERDFIKQVNAEVKRLHTQSCSRDPEREERLRALEQKISNIRQAIEDGLTDTDWANARLNELLAEHRSIASEAVSGRKPQPPRIGAQAVRGYLADTNRLLAHGTNREKKRLLAAWVEKIELAPEDLEIEIRYKVPEPVADRMGAGAGFEPTTFGL